jgi:hypothetical protein
LTRVKGATARARQVGWAGRLCSTSISHSEPLDAVKRRAHHHVYVIELHPDVLQEPRFRRCNPGYVEGRPCVYVGMTGLDPDLRFDRHKAGIQANAFVTKYGLRLLPDLYEGFNPMGYDEAAEREVEIGIDLRSAGFGVWQA